MDNSGFWILVRYLHPRRRTDETKLNIGIAEEKVEALLIDSYIRDGCELMQSKGRGN